MISYSDLMKADPSKVKVGNDQEMTQSERNSKFKNRGRGKNKLTIRY